MSRQQLHHRLNQLYLTSGYHNITLYMKLKILHLTQRKPGSGGEGI
jgi:hypothetical protein